MRALLNELSVATTVCLSALLFVVQSFALDPPVVLDPAVILAPFSIDLAKSVDSTDDIGEKLAFVTEKPKLVERLQATWLK